MTSASGVKSSKSVTQSFVFSHSKWLAVEPYTLLHSCLLHVPVTPSFVPFVDHMAQLFPVAKKLWVGPLLVLRGQ
jgi:hypothetical protein